AGPLADLIDELALGEAELDDHVADAALDPGSLGGRHQPRDGKWPGRGGSVHTQPVSAAIWLRSSPHGLGGGEHRALPVGEDAKALDHVRDLEHAGDRAA